MGSINGNNKTGTIISLVDILELAEINGCVTVNGVVWNFTAFGLIFTHETDDLYLISDRHGNTGSINRRQWLILVIEPNGDIESFEVFGADE